MVFFFALAAPGQPVAVTVEAGAVTGKMVAATGFSVSRLVLPPSSGGSSVGGSVRPLFLRPLLAALPVHCHGEGEGAVASLSFCMFTDILYADRCMPPG